MSSSRKYRHHGKSKKKKNQRRLGFERKHHDGTDDEDYDVEVDTVEIDRKREQDRASRRSAHEHMAQESKKNTLISFTTDDFKIRRLVSSTTDLPLNKYTSLGAIFQNKAMAKTFSEYSYPVMKTPKDAISSRHILGPLTPGRMEHMEQQQRDQQTAARNAAMVPPKQFPEAERPEGSRLGMPPVGEDMWDPTKAPHDGVVWPMAWAPRPPFTTPGYQRKGVKQPVGVIQVERVPTGQSKGNTDYETEDLPTWVSPLYRVYGIGGPYGPFGPFYEPPNIDVESTDAVKAALETTPAPKKCLLMRLWESFRKKDIATKDKSLAMFLELLDEKLAAIRASLRTDKKDDREMMTDVVLSLSTVLDDAKEFETKLDSKDVMRTSIDSSELEEQLLRTSESEVMEDI